MTTSVQFAVLATLEPPFGEQKRSEVDLGSLNHATHRPRKELRVARTLTASISCDCSGVGSLYLFDKTVNLADDGVPRRKYPCLFIRTSAISSRRWLVALAFAALQNTVVGAAFCCACVCEREKDRVSSGQHTALKGKKCGGAMSSDRATNSWNHG